MSSRNDKVRDVLFIPSGSIGDALMMLGLCAELQAHDPQLSFTIIARRNAGLISDLARAYPAIRVVMIKRNVVGITTLLWTALRKPWIVLMPAAFGKGFLLNTKNLFGLLALRPGTKTVGLLKEEESNSYDTALVYEPGLIHFDNMRHMARAAGLEVDADGSPIHLTLASVPARVGSVPAGKYLIYHPFGSSTWKSFPPSRSRALLQALVDAYPDLSIVVTGGSENAEEAAEITAGIPRVSRAIGLPILEVAAIVRGSALYTGVDTGMTHLVGVLLHPSIVLEHNASPEWIPTYNPHARILTTHERCVCGGKKNDQCKVEVDGKPYLRCLYDITDAMILEAVSKELGK